MGHIHTTKRHWHWMERRNHEQALKGPAGPTDEKSPPVGGLFVDAIPAHSGYFSFVSLYMTCLRATGSNFLISIFSGISFLFLDVV